MPAVELARPICERLDGPADPLAVARWLHQDPGAVALSGAWAGGGTILTSHPLRQLTADADPFAALDQPPVTICEADIAPRPVVGGGWFGWLGFALARRIEELPPAPPRPAPLPPFQLAFHDHVVRCDPTGAWFFEALWTEARAGALRERLTVWRERLRTRAPELALASAWPLDGTGEQPLDRPGATLSVLGPGGAGHAAAVAEAIARIAAGDLSQVNVCLRLDATFTGDLLELWCRGVAASRPAHAAYFAGVGHAVASLSPELFLRRRGRTVLTRPIKGTAPRATDPALLQASVKDRAENLMIVDLMRNDLGRVCEYGSVRATELCAVEPAAGVWHLVSTVEGTLRPGVGDGALLRATFPPGSVTGAPKVQALQMIQELEPTAREVFCGAVGMVSPLCGLELAVAIRTLELRGEDLWLGAGGGVVSDSTPEGELAEALAKARGVAAAVGLEVEPGGVIGSAEVIGSDATAPRRPAQVTGSHQPAPGISRLPRPDPALGVFDTIRVHDGALVAADEHRRRLADSCRVLGLELPANAVARVGAEAAAFGGASGGVRIAVTPEGLEITSRVAPEPGATALEPVILPGGLGAHKWCDRRLVDALSAPGVTPLICDLDGEVLEAGYAGVLIFAGGSLHAPPIDRRRLDSVSRRAALSAARAGGLNVVTRPLSIADLTSAEAIILTSSLRGPHAGTIALGPPAEASERICRALRS